MKLVLFRNYFILVCLFSLYLFLPPSFSISHASDLINPWSTTVNLPYSLASHVSQSFSGKVFVIGGATSGVISANLSSTVNADGSLQSWNSSINSPSIYWHSSAIKDNFIYLLGGTTYPPTTSVTSVYLGKIDDSGLVSSWMPLTPLLEPSSLGAATIIGNKIYFAGGFNEQSGSIVVNQGVYWALINADGTIGDWTLAGLLPQPMSGFGLVASGNNLIIVGGIDQNNNFLAATQISTINPDGSLVGWQQTSSLPEAIYRAGVAQVENQIFIVGGYNGSSYLDKVYYATINDNGTLSEWNLSQHRLPKQVCCGAAAATNEYIYLTGGFNGSYLDTVYFTKLNNNSINLPVPLLKQTDSDWASDVYDQANLWSPSDSTIGSWGCALTSAAMVFNYHGITKLPDTSFLTPGTLNNWLKNQPDGYVRNGLVNWLALARLSKEAKDSGLNPDFAFDALEFQKIVGMNNSRLDADLDNSQPDILEEPGHFVVVTGKQNTTYSINDPVYSRETLLDGYSNSYLSLNRFIPSHTNLSYIQVIGDEYLNLILKNSTQTVVGEGILLDPLGNDNSPGHKSGQILSQLLSKNPDSGSYTLTLKGNKLSVYTLDLYLYDKNGDPYLSTISGFITKNKTETLSLTFDEENHDNTNVKKIVTFAQLIDDINEAIALKKINKGFGKGLITIAKSAQRTNNKSKPAAKAQLDTMLRLLNQQKDRLVDETSFTILSQDISTLKQNL